MPLLFTNFFAGGAPAGPPPDPTDPDFASVVFLMNMAGTVGGTDAVDLSNSSHAITYNGGLVLSGSPLLHQATSLVPDGSNDNLSVPDSIDFTPAAGAYTWEARVRSPTTNTQRIIMAHYLATTSQRSWILDFLPNGPDLNVRLVLSANGLSTAGNIMVVQGGSVPLGTNVEIAADITAAGAIKVYLDGAVVATGNRSSLTLNTVHNSTTTFRVATTSDLVTPFNSAMYELRLTKGVARYQGAYTPTGKTYPIS